MGQLVWVFVVLLGTVSSLSATEPKPFDPLSIDPIVVNALRVWSAPGVAIAIVKDGQPVLVKGYGLKQHDGKESVTPNTVFPLGSCTKAFTSALIAELVDADKMTWDDPVRKHFPAFKLGDPNADALVTLRDLLTHRTGVASHDFLWYRASWNLDETIRRTSLLPVSSPFRGSYQYSTLMYLVAGQAAAKQMGQPWQELVRERITKPLGMTNTPIRNDFATIMVRRVTANTTRTVRCGPAVGRPARRKMLTRSGEPISRQPGSGQRPLGSGPLHRQTSYRP